MQKAGLLTPFPWVGMFACGVLAQRHFHLLRPYVEGRLLWWTAVSVGGAVAGRYIDAPLLFRTGVNAVGLVHFAAMMGLVLSAAYTWPQLADNSWTPPKTSRFRRGRDSLPLGSAEA